MKHLLLTICLLLVANIGAQNLTEKQKEREKNKVKIYTPDEYDNLQIAFREGVDAMKLSEDKLEQYDAIVLKYVSKMVRLNDKDQGNSPEEVKIKFSENIDQMNAEVKEMLSPKEYVMHLENIHKIVYSVNTRLEKLVKE
ncbi:hypothetical protein [Algibacter mikhailovii]|uniref:Uncharacterized protein n=1 Tax=Algibacter mikhailovii TaxID=425498 RepID=A0A918VA31_9FLAO|nr:hypothetical protein [Algibacter mikhailovii]GGZ80030.1 hypothetical protein GCM10007028_17030 [Algibacter mikhailovii]